MHRLNTDGTWRMWELERLNAELGEPIFRGPVNDIQTEANDAIVVRWNCSTPAGVAMCNAFSANVIGGEEHGWVLMMPCDRHSHLAQLANDAR